jgi:hypothetical protein
MVVRHAETRARGHAGTRKRGNAETREPALLRRAANYSSVS